jgi:hypothetical protein
VVQLGFRVQACRVTRNLNPWTQTLNPAPGGDGFQRPPTQRPLQPQAQRAAHFFFQEYRGDHQECLANACVLLVCDAVHEGALLFSLRDMRLSSNPIRCWALVHDALSAEASHGMHSAACARVEYAWC